MKAGKTIGNALTVAVVTMTLGLAAVQPAAAQTLSYTTGLDVWFDAQDMNGNGDGNSGWTDGNTLSTSKTWVNKGSAGNPVSYAYRTQGAVPGSPVFRSSVTYPAGGTGPAVEFTSDNMRLPEFLDSPNVSMFAVVQRTGNATGVDTLLWDYGSTGSQLINFYLDPDNNNTGNVTGAVRDGGGKVITATGTSAIGMDVAIVEMILSGSNGSFSLEAGPLGATATAGNAAYVSTTWNGTFRAPVVGSFPGTASAGYMIGHIFELLIFDHAVTGADRTAVEDYLSAKYISRPIPGTLIYVK